MRALLSSISVLISLNVLFVGAEETPGSRDKKVLPIFQVVKFQNEFCTSASTSRNGTCYTRQECESKGGTIGSECAEGFGVCCSFELSCGGTSSENATYIINTNPTASCSYTICPCTENVCRVRFDFETMQLAVPVQGTAAAAGTENVGGAIGDCKTDQFSITGKGSGSPVICGTNTGQHMIMDADNDNCHTVTVNINTATTATRSWTIHVSQYTCADEYSGGPPGCLQYLRETPGVISSFGYDRSATSVADSTTHLSNQDYTICFRRAMANCAICYFPAISVPASSTGVQNSFGLGLGNAIVAKAQVNTQCSADYITIPGGTAAANVAAAALATDPGANRVCGRYLASAADAVASVSICSRITPFTLGVHTDADEMTTSTDMASTNEMVSFPGGIIGFSLSYAQICT